MREEIAYRELQEEMAMERQQGQQQGQGRDFHDKGAQSEAHRATERESKVPPGPGRMPTPEEEAAAEKQSVPPGVGEHYEEMLERGAHQEGEGRIP